MHAYINWFAKLLIKVKSKTVPAKSGLKSDLGILSSIGKVRLHDCFYLKKLSKKTSRYFPRERLIP